MPHLLGGTGGPGEAGVGAGAEGIPDPGAAPGARGGGGGGGDAGRGERMGGLGRSLTVGLVVAPVAVAVWLLLVSWVLAVLALTAGSAGFLALGAVATRRDARDAYWRTRRCASCGLGVPDRATRCPACGSAALVGPRHPLERDRPAEQRRQAQAAAERQRDTARRNRELGLFAVPFRYFGRYVTFLQSGFGLDPSDPAEMRWWAAALLLLAGLFATVGVATEFGAWAPGVPVLAAALGASMAAAHLGPHAMAER